MATQRKIVAVVRKVSLKNQPSDAAYWTALPVAERLYALEEIRREYHGWTYETEPRLQRVLTVVRR